MVGFKEGVVADGGVFDTGSAAEKCKPCFAGKKKVKESVQGIFYSLYLVWTKPVLVLCGTDQNLGRTIKGC